MRAAKRSKRKHGFYTRFALTLTATYLIFIQRYYCPSCKRTVSLLPSFLAPSFQYTLACIFFSFYLIAVRLLTLESIASKINPSSGRTEMSHQHISDSIAAGYWRIDRSSSGS